MATGYEVDYYRNIKRIAIAIEKIVKLLEKWDSIDELEEKKIGSSFENLQKEKIRQGYKGEKDGTNKKI